MLYGFYTDFFIKRTDCLHGLQYHGNFNSSEKLIDFNSEEDYKKFALYLYEQGYRAKERFYIENEFNLSSSESYEISEILRRIEKKEEEI